MIPKMCESGMDIYSNIADFEDRNEMDGLEEGEISESESNIVDLNTKTCGNGCLGCQSCLLERDSFGFIKKVCN